MRIKSFSSMVGKIVMAIVFVTMIGSIYIAPAFGKDGDDRRGYNQQGRYEQGRYQHGRYQHGHYERGRYVPHTYYYPQPVYAPPPVVYVPAPSPGISLVFPIHIR
jgi:hypothetical protein